MRLLLLAEACNPAWTSVPLVGYNMVRAIAQRDDIDATIVTHIRNKESLLVDPLARMADIEFIDNEWLAGPLYRAGQFLRGGKSLGWTTNMAVNWPAYIAFEKAVHKRFRSKLQRGEFDLIHRVTPVSPTLPSPLAALTDVPMLIGPLNGGLPWPSMYPELRQKEREWLVPLRKAYQRLPYFQATYRHAAGVIAGSTHTASEIPDSLTGQRFFLPENGIDPERFTIADGWTPPTDQFCFVAVGRLVPYKGFHFILNAMAHSQRLHECALSIIGDGPERATLEQLATSLGIADRVQFCGWLPQAELAARLRSSQAFVFPSLREFGGGVVLEAMASGLPSIIVNYGGPAELIDESTGLAIPLQPEQPLTRDLQTAMERLVNDHDLCRSMAKIAIGHVREQHTWSKKAETVAGFYQQLLRPVEASHSQFLCSDHSVPNSPFAIPRS